MSRLIVLESRARSSFLCKFTSVILLCVGFFLLPFTRSPLFLLCCFLLCRCESRKQQGSIVQTRTLCQRYSTAFPSLMRRHRGLPRDRNSLFTFVWLMDAFTYMPSFTVPIHRDPSPVSSRDDCVFYFLSFFAFDRSLPLQHSDNK